MPPKRKSTAAAYPQTAPTAILPATTDAERLARAVQYGFKPDAEAPAPKRTPARTRRVLTQPQHVGGGGGYRQ